jgi:hypothetical protein
MRSSVAPTHSSVATNCSSVASIPSGVASIRSSVALIRSGVALIRSGVALTRSSVAPTSSGVAPTRSGVVPTRSGVALTRSNVAPSVRDVRACCCKRYTSACHRTRVVQEKGTRERRRETGSRGLVALAMPPLPHPTPHSPLPDHGLNPRSLRHNVSTRPSSLTTSVSSMRTPSSRSGK